MRQIIFILVLLFFGVTSHSYAQSVRDYVRVTDPDNWVFVDEVPSDSFDLANGLQTAYQLLSYQSMILPDDQYRYTRIVSDLQTKSSVEDNGTLTVTFDPTFQTIDFHHINIVRDGVARSVLSLDSFEIYRVETDRDKLLYNGDLQIGFAVPGLQEGDRLDYAYTIRGVNPALAGGYYDRQSLAYSVPIRLLRNKLLIDPAFEIHTRSHNGAEDPKRYKEGILNIVEWEKANIEAIQVDDNVPSWQYTRPVYETSNFKSWDEVGAHFSQYYTLTEPVSGEIQKIIDEIASRSVDPKRRTREALDYVQSNIRYLGIELGEGGFVPRAPDLVLERRFGDCKDVTLLLLTLLDGLGIEAKPVLVNTNERAEFIQSLPGLTAFNHVLVRAVIGDEDFYLDATRGEQLGSLDKIDQGSFGKGLVLDGRYSKIVEADKTDFEWRKDFIDQYDLISHPDDIGVKIELNYYGEDADSNQDWHESEGLQSVEKAYLDYFADFYPSIEQSKPTQVEANKTKGKFSVTLFYTIKDAWEKHEKTNSKTFWAIPYEVKADMPEFSGAKRSLPFALAYPKKTRQRIQYLVDETWEFALNKTELDNDYISYLREESFDGKVYEEDYSYVTKRDHLPAEGFGETMQQIETIRDEYGSTITMPLVAPKGWRAWSEAQWTGVFMILFLSAGILAAIGASIQNNYDLAWRSEVVLHPVSMKKFIFLSLLTIGHYQIYWFYKNWQWIKTVGNEDIWPIARSFFAGIMNFVLFPKIAEVGKEKEKVGYAWYGAIALPLAFIYLIGNALDRFVTNQEGIPEWTSFITVITLFIAIPVVMQVNRYNSDVTELVKKHSKFSLFTWLLVILYAPIAIAVYYGLGVILVELF